MSSSQGSRRPSTSRTPTSRPRRVAGQYSTPVDIDVESGDPPVESVVAPLESVLPPVESGPGTPDSTAETPDSTGETPDSTGETPESTVRPGLAALFDSRRATTVLLSLVAVLALAAGGLFAWDALKGDDGTAQPSEQPVVVSGDDANAGVDAAAKAAEKILTRSYQGYDKQVDEATALMTPSFAKEFSQTAGDVEKDFVDAKTDQQARVVAQGVVHATRTEVQALVFLNYYVSQNGGDTTYTAYRALVTVVHTDRGWLVSGIDTK
jgi:Mce-associated membrane protein